MLVCVRACLAYVQIKRFLIAFSWKTSLQRVRSAKLDRTVHEAAHRMIKPTAVLVRAVRVRMHTPDFRHESDRWS